MMLVLHGDELFALDGGLRGRGLSVFATVVPDGDPMKDSRRGAGLERVRLPSLSAIGGGAPLAFVLDDFQWSASIEENMLAGLAGEVPVFDCFSECYWVRVG
jgi:hypothetical protein